MNRQKIKTLRFRFYEELNDFLPSERRKINFSHKIINNPSIKDVIESLGVPHAEIDLILVNGESVDFNYHPNDGDEIAVYPVFESLDITSVTHLRPKPLRQTQFILDVHLGKLARYLRMIGFDVLYRNDYSDETIVELASTDHRIILTRDIALLKNKCVTHGYWIRNTKPSQQLLEVLQRFDLYQQIHPFKRCMLCNGSIQPINKNDIVDKLLPKTEKYFHEFYQCRSCDKIYWKGSHYEKMVKVIEAIKG